MKKQAGLTFLEILLVISIIAVLTILVLTAVSSSRKKAFDNRIRAGVSQLRILAQIVYDSQNGSYENWTEELSIQNSLSTTLEDIDKNYGDAPGAPYVTVLRESQTQDFCVSAPLQSTNTYYCVDATARFDEVSSPCPDQGDDDSGDPPLRCPSE